MKNLLRLIALLSALVLGIPARWSSPDFVDTRQV